MTSILKQFGLSPPQAEAVEARVRDVVVSAGAGTGKTRTLVARFLSLLDDGIPLRQIVAITFTRKAAREMRNRVRRDIGRFLAQPDLEADEYGRWQHYHNELDAARIGTIHNLCSEILHNHPAEAGVDPHFEVLDEVQSALLLKEAVEATLAWAVQPPTPSPVNDLEVSITQLFRLLSERQLQDLIAAMLYERPTMATLTKALPPEELYSRWQSQLEASQEAALEQLTADPFWQESIATLRQAVPLDTQDTRAAQREMVLTAVQEADGQESAVQCQLLAALGSINLRGGSIKAWQGGREEANAVKAALGGLRKLWRDAAALSLSLNQQDETLSTIMPAVYNLFNYANRTYQIAKNGREALDFDDLEGRAVALLVENTAVRYYWQRQVGALLVDEFQDTNERQRQFIRLLCPEPGKLFIVGDAKQSIYRFRGADVTVFQTEREGIKSTGGKAVNLDTSYRAHSTLLEGMNRLLKPILGEDSPQRPNYVAPFDRLEAADQSLPTGLTIPFVEFHLALGNKGEALPLAAAGLATRLVELEQNSPLTFGDMAILCRASSAFQYYENALDAAGIPYLTVAGKGFYDRPEIRDLLNVLQATADPHDDLALAGYLRSPGCGLSDESLFYLAQARQSGRSLWETVQQGFQFQDLEEQTRLVWAAKLLNMLHELSGRTSVADLLKIFLEETNYLAALRLAGLPRALRNVDKLLTDIHSSSTVNVIDFLVYAGSLKDSGSREGEARSTAGGVVQIMSIHAAKGLEFPVVVLGDAAATGSNRGQNVLIDPVLGVLLGNEGEDGQKSTVYELGKQRNGGQEAAELDRLLYVALTRAEQILMISGHGSATKAETLSLKGWLGQLGKITGLSDCALTDYNEAGEQAITFNLTVEDTAVNATLYEPNFRANYIKIAGKRKVVNQEILTQAHQYLNTAIIKLQPDFVGEKDTPNRVWQVVSTAKRPQAPAWLIGTLVHEAIALWRFPGNGFERWVRARSKTYGLTDKLQLADAVSEVGRLLQRFQNWDLFPEIENAKVRFHELPYNYDLGDTVETGYIDLLYQHDGRWTIIDFKTDDIRDESEVKQAYTAQVRRYGTAVTKLLGEQPRQLLCYLNGPIQIISTIVS